MRLVRAALQKANIQPLRGREYFDLPALTLICGVTQSHLGESLLITPRLA